LIEKYVRSGRVDLVIHLGDQIYADEAFKQGMELLKRERKHPKGSEPISESVKETIAELYRYILANISLLLSLSLSHLISSHLISSHLISHLTSHECVDEFS
jgi:fatty acid-binding protein DegV